MRYMLDTDICICTINERPRKVLSALRRFHSAGLGISAVTASELYFGVARTGSQRNLDALRRFLATLEVAPTPIGPYDTLIAAHAHAMGAILVTNNTREFERVPGLKFENWAA